MKQEIAHALFKFEMLVPKPQKSNNSPTHHAPVSSMIDLSLMPELEDFKEIKDEDTRDSPL